MGRSSTKENKNIYQLRREELGLTREEASELCQGISPERIEKIENDKCKVFPEDVMIMAEGYKYPELCNLYCSKECAIGKNYISEIKIKDLSQIVLKAISSINTIEKQKDNLINICEDGVISDEEIKDFVRIENDLEKLSNTVDALKLWTRKMISEGNINEELYKTIKNKEN